MVLRWGLATIFVAVAVVQVITLMAAPIFVKAPSSVAIDSATFGPLPAVPVGPSTTLSDQIFKRSSNEYDYSTYEPFDRIAETPRQKERRRKAEAEQRALAEQRAREVPYSQRPPLTDDEMTAKFDDKIESHKKGGKNLIRKDRKANASTSKSKWTTRKWAVESRNQQALYKEYVYYRNKENSLPVGSEERAKERRKKNYYRGKLDIDPEAGGSSAAPANPPPPPAAPVPGTPEGGHYYSSVPGTPALDPNQYYAGNWGQGGADWGHGGYQ